MGHHNATQGPAPRAPMESLAGTPPDRKPVNYSGFTIYDDVRLLDVPQPTWQVAEMFLPGSLSLIYSLPGVGKTTLMTGLACSWASGLPFLDFAITAAAPVVYVATEGLAGFRNRLVAWKVSRGLPPDTPIGVHVVRECVRLPDLPSVCQFIGAVENLCPGLVVFDPVARCCSGHDENSTADMSLLVDRVDRIRSKLGCAVSLIHHSGKDGKSERGSSTLRGAADTILKLVTAGGVLALHCEKQRDAEQFNPIRLKLRPVTVPDGTACIVELADSLSIRLTGKQQQVLAALRASGAATSAQWQQSAAGISERGFHHIKALLKDRGFVRQVGPLFTAGDCK